ncbi:MAG TPA: phage Gp37/Gp68 family protein [Rhizomicrobium sp.]|jgi:protein gp37|nr:phage Gp37/Gp68 family protein [Rhizomicrobium sp.]
MGASTGIEWTDATWTPIRAARTGLSGRPIGPGGKIGWHCEHVSEGCRNCYAETLNKRLGTGLDFKPGHRGDIKIFLDEKMLLAPLRWRKPKRIFVCSMTDLFADFVTDDYIAMVMAFVAAAYWHTFQILTKRPERMRALFSDEQFWHAVDEELLCIDDEAERLRLYDPLERRTDDWRAMCPDVLSGKPLANVWAGTSCEDQATAGERIPHLLATPAAVRFLSCEPLLGAIDLTWSCNGFYFLDSLRGLKMHDAPEGVRSATEKCPHVDWVICGGESGPNARPMHPDWARSLRDQCAAAGVTFFFKQWGDPGPVTGAPEWRRNLPRLSKNLAGRLLDGIEHNAMPELR